MSSIVEEVESYHTANPTQHHIQRCNTQVQTRASCQNTIQDVNLNLSKTVCRLAGFFVYCPAFKVKLRFYFRNFEIILKLSGQIMCSHQLNWQKFQLFWQKKACGFEKNYSKKPFAFVSVFSFWKEFIKFLPVCKLCMLGLQKINSFTFLSSKNASTTNCWMPLKA